MTFPSFDFHAHGGITGDGLRSFLVHCAKNNVSDIFLQGGGPLVVDLHGRKIRASEFRIEPPQLCHRGKPPSGHRYAGNNDG